MHNTLLFCMLWCVTLWVYMQVKERKLKEFEKDYPTYLEQQAELEDPLRRLEVSF